VWISFYHIKNPWPTKLISEERTASYVIIARKAGQSQISASKSMDFLNGMKVEKAGKVVINLLHKFKLDNKL